MFLSMKFITCIFCAFFVPFVINTLANGENENVEARIKTMIAAKNNKPFEKWFLKKYHYIKFDPECDVAQEKQLYWNCAKRYWGKGYAAINLYEYLFQDMFAEIDYNVQKMTSFVFQFPYLRHQSNDDHQVQGCFPIESFTRS